ncbi:uncharacterized protein LOC110860771 [Folsomia candida]|uniref:F-box domain-containing protein n=1 Tax=Folsomia candida TaxID=158441 RepID=A0A226D5N7_FOLCA|nr:uncharacterized protein LOC110860771 [Folsomia candida]OXA40194.1 hypothetical protein Fcan01_25052 [Folsomia candida]
MEPQRERSVQEVALNNPIILTEILKQSSAPLKSCRLVSHFWNEMVLSLRNTRLALNLNTKDEEVETYPLPFLAFFDLCSKFDARLAKRVTGKTSNCTEETYPLAGKLSHLCISFSDRVEILDMRINYEDCLKSISLVFRNSLPNLKQLRIRFAFFDDNEEYDYVPKREIFVTPLPEKPNLTVFNLKSEVVAASPILTSFAQLVVNASPNLREATLPWGFYPDLERSKFLDTLTLELDDARGLDVALKQLNPSELTRMLDQVGGQLLHLSFSYSTFHYGKSMTEDYHVVDNSTPPGFRLLRKMPKLRKFDNEMIDIIQHSDLWQDIGRMPALKSLRIGKIWKDSTSVDTSLKNLFEKQHIFTNVADLRIHELHDPRLLDGLKTAFPNLQKLWLDNKEAGMELGVVLKACVGWGGLNHLHIGLPTYAKKMWDIVKALLDCAELYKDLKSLEIETHSWDLTWHDLTETELHVFKEALYSMKGMDRVVIRDLYFGDESRRNILDVMASNEMPMWKFKVVQE